MSPTQFHCVVATWSVKGTALASKNTAKKWISFGLPEDSAWDNGREGQPLVTFSILKLGVDQGQHH
jgi:hypothetical protein